MSLLNGSQYNEFPQNGAAATAAILPVNLATSTGMGAQQMGMFEKQNGGSRRRRRGSRRAIKGGAALEFSEFSTAAASGASAPVATIEQPLLKMPIAALSTGGKSRKLRLKKSKGKYIIGGMVALSPANIVDTGVSVSKLPVVGGKRRTNKYRKTRKSTKHSRKSAKNLFKSLFGK